MGILDGGFWVEVKFKDYSSRSTYIHIYFEFWPWEVSVIYWERNSLNCCEDRFENLSRTWYIHPYQLSACLECFWQTSTVDGLTKLSSLWALGLSWHVCSLSLNQPMTDLAILFLKILPEAIFSVLSYLPRSNTLSTGSVIKCVLPLTYNKAFTTPDFCRD